MQIRRSWMLAALLGASLALPAAAQDYPRRTVRMVVPVSAGSGTDTSARFFATALAKAWDQPVIVDNKPGAGVAIGTDYVAKSQPDGYTLLFTYAAHYSGPWIDKVPYDALRDFEPIARVSNSALILMTAPGSPLKTVRDVLAAAKQKPDSLSYSSAGNGTTAHMAGSLLTSMTGATFRHVPYKTPAQAVVDVAGGLVDFGIGGLVTALPLIKGGRLRVIAVTTATRSSHLPDVPTVAESGVPGFENSSPIWVMAPRGTPKPIIDKLSEAFTRTAARPEFKELCQAQGLEVDIQDAATAKAAGPAESEKWRRLVELTAAKAN